MTVEEGGDLQQLARACSIFSSKSLTAETVGGPKLLRS
jgi:hypothetical protein